jgi:hypothetical protein
VGALDHPAARLESGLALDRLRLFATRANMRGEPELLRELPDLLVVVALVEAELLRVAPRRFGLLYGNALDGFPGELEVIAVGAIDREAERDAGGVRQDGTLRSLLGAVRRIRAGFFPLRAAPSS